MLDANSINVSTSQEKDDLDNEDGGGTALNEQTEIVAKDGQLQLVFEC